MAVELNSIELDDAAFVLFFFVVWKCFCELSVQCVRKDRKGEKRETVMSII